MDKIIVKCLNCGRAFEVPSNSDKKYCSRDCYTAYRRKSLERVCPHCGKTFVNLINHTKYCSRDCAREAQSEIMRAGGLESAEKVKKMHDALSKTGSRDRDMSVNPDAICPVCHKLMPYYRKTCSPDCAHELRRISRLHPVSEHVCPTCGKSFTASGRRVYCSPECRDRRKRTPKP